MSSIKHDSPLTISTSIITNQTYNDNDNYNDYDIQYSKKQKLENNHYKPLTIIEFSEQYNINISNQINK